MTRLEMLKKKRALLVQLQEAEASAGQESAAAPEPAADDPSAGEFGGGKFKGNGASEAWGHEDPGFLSAMLTKAAQGWFKGGSDEAVGGTQAAMLAATKQPLVRLVNGPRGKYWERYEANPREGGQRGPWDLYRDSRDYQRQRQAAADEHYPVSGFLAEAGGDIASDALVAGPNVVRRGYQTLSGLARGLMQSDAELTPGRATPWTAGEAALSSLVGGAIGNQAPVLMSKVAKSELANLLGSTASDALTYSGDRLKNVGGWLKVNSVHPTPVVSEAMESIPGGLAGVGREALGLGIGGRTKASTASQAQAHLGRAGKAVTQIAKEHDAAGGAPVAVGDAMDAAKQKAQELFVEPTTKTAGERLAKLVEEYEATLGPNRSLSAFDALKMKRALAKAAYGAKQQLKKAGDNVAGDYGEGLSVFERSVDDVLDNSLGSQFGGANLRYRRLLGFSNAAKRDAARQSTNLLALGLQNMGGGSLGAMLGGGPGAAAGLGATWFLRKYGSQLGARSLYNAGRLAQWAPRFAATSAGYGQAAPSGVMSKSAAQTLADLLAPEPSYRPAAFAMEDE